MVVRYFLLFPTFYFIEGLTEKDECSYSDVIIIMYAHCSPDHICHQIREQKLVPGPLDNLLETLGPNSSSWSMLVLVHFRASKRKIKPIPEHENNKSQTEQVVQLQQPWSPEVEAEQTEASLSRAVFVCRPEHSVRHRHHPQARRNLQSHQ